MTTVAEAAAIAVGVVNLLAAVVGGWLWWRVDPRPLAWLGIRLGQIAAVLQAAVAGIFYISGHEPDDDLYALYAVLPILVGFVAEQLRLASAQTVLDAHGIPDAQALGERPLDEQQRIVLQIMGRELGVMVLGALVVAFLGFRGLGTIG